MTKSRKVSSVKRRSIKKQTQTRKKGGKYEIPVIEQLKKAIQQAITNGDFIVRPSFLMKGITNEQNQDAIKANLNPLKNYYETKPQSFKSKVVKRFGLHTFTASKEDIIALINSLEKGQEYESDYETLNLMLVRLSETTAKLAPHFFEERRHKWNI